MVRYEKQWQVARQRIEAARERAGRPPGAVRLLAVSKTFPAEAIRAVHGLGQRAFGENYVQEARRKRDELADVLFSVLLMAHELNLNLGQAFLDKLQKTAEKYPIEKSKGSPKKYTEL